MPDGLAGAVAATREEFREALARAGFTVRSSERAEIDLDVRGSDGPVRFIVKVGPRFPFHPPKVFTETGTGPNSWHRDLDGGLCLYGDVPGLPWRDPKALIDRIREWWACAADGWSDDFPDLDLERYWEQAKDDPLLVYEEAELWVGVSAQVRRKGNILALEVGRRSTKSKANSATAWVGSMGQLDEPVRAWQEVIERLQANGLAPADAAQLAKQVESGRTNYVGLAYERGAHHGVLILKVASRQPLRLVAVPSAATGPTVRSLRAGRDVELLRSKHVVLVGVGAVGSTLAELLCRAGIGTLTLVDGDRMRPGNVVRHLSLVDGIGQSKVKAVKSELERRGLADDATVNPVNAPLEVTNAERVLEGADFVVDATGSDRVAHLLMTACYGQSEWELAIASLHRAGSVARVDRFPLVAGEAHDDPIPALPADPTVEVFEAGCGDPVSPAPMWACTAAASLAAAVVTDRLSGRRALPATVSHTLMPDLEPT